MFGAAASRSRFLRPRELIRSKNFPYNFHGRYLHRSSSVFENNSFQLRNNSNFNARKTNSWNFYSHPTFNAFLSDLPLSRSFSHPNAIGKGRVLFSTSVNNKDEKSQSLCKSNQEEQVANMKILRTVASYLWMKDNYEFRFRVIVALGFLVGAKVLNVQVPFLFKFAVDWLATATTNAGYLPSFTAANSTLLALFATPAAVMIGYGIARTGASAFNELRNAVFSKVALRTI